MAWQSVCVGNAMCCIDVELDALSKNTRQTIQLCGGHEEKQEKLFIVFAVA